MSDNKRTNGQYFTECNPFRNDGFIKWSNECNIGKNVILEQFSGSNNLISMLQEMNLCNNFASYDIEPQNANVLFKDTLKDFPQGFKVCITNPPYLAQNSAKRRGLFYPHTKFDDLYKFVLSKCLENCEYVGAIIPVSFLNAKIFRDRLSHYILLNNLMLSDTQHPVCLALFTQTSQSTQIYEGDKYLGLLSEIEAKIPNNAFEFDMKFNDKNGKLGLLAIDNTVEPSIRFCKGNEIDSNKISNSSRSITRISIDCDVEKLLKKVNDRLNCFREETYDLLLTPFKGLRRDNKFRRRRDYATARLIINDCIYG